MQLPVLSIIIFSPIIAGLIVFLLPKERVKEIKILALVSTVISLLLSLAVYFSYNIDQAGYQFVERFAWLPSLGISYLVGVDGISAPMVLLTGIVACTGVMISWGVAERPREFFGFLLILAGSVFGVFASLDLFMLFFFFEIAVFPKFLMISVWGWPKTREYGAMKLTLYLFIGSVIALVGALAIYTQSGLNTFDLSLLETGKIFARIPTLVVPVRLPRLCDSGRHLPVPLLGTGWSCCRTDSHLHAVGWCRNESGRVRCLARRDHAVAGRCAFLGAFDHCAGSDQCRLRRSDRLDANRFQVCHRFFLCLSHGAGHVGFCQPQSEMDLIGAGMQMFSHGVMTAMFFAIVGMVYDRAHTRELPKLGGMFKMMPFAAIGFIIAGSGVHGHAGILRFRSRIPDLYGIVAGFAHTRQSWPFSA